MQAAEKKKYEWKSKIPQLPAEGEYEKRIEHYKRKISHKAPVTLRYGAVAGFVCGLVGLVRKKSIWRLPGHLIVTTNLVGWALCYQELTGIIQNYYYLKTK